VTHLGPLGRAPHAHAGSAAHGSGPAEDSVAADGGSVGSIEHVVQRGQTLWGIAKHHLGDGNRYREIYEANRAVIGPDLYAIRAGMKLVVPQVGPVAAANPGARSHAARSQAPAAESMPRWEALRREAATSDDPGAARAAADLGMRIWAHSHPGLAGVQQLAPQVAAPAARPQPGESVPPLAPPPELLVPQRPLAPPPPAPLPQPVPPRQQPSPTPAPSAVTPRPAPPPPAAAGLAGPGSAPAQVPDPRVAPTVRSFVSPSGTGANTTLTGRLFVGASLREGDGAPPASWTGVPAKPYREVFAGWSLSELMFDAGGRLDAIQSRFVTGYATGDGRSNLGVQLWRELEPDAAGRQAVGAQASFAALGADGKPGTRIDLQVASPPAVSGATPRLAGRAEQFIPLGESVLRVRATAAHSGVPGQTVGASASVAIDPPPSSGTFPAGPRGAAMRPSVEIAVSHVPAPLPGRPDRATDTVAVSAGLASPDTVLTATVSRARTDTVTQVRLSGTAMTRLGPGDIGDPPTTVTAGGVDPVGMPTGRYPAGSRGTNTTAYARFAVTLENDGPRPKPGTTFPGPDSVTVGVVHTRSHGPVANAYAQATADVTRHADGTAPAERVALEAGVHLRPDDSLPVTVHVSGRAGAGGNAMSAGITVMPDRNTALEAGARFDVDRSEVQPYAKVRIRL